MPPTKPPQDRTIRKVVEYLNSIELSVYGPCANLDTGEQFGAHMDYDADAIIKYRKVEVWVDGDE